MNRLKIPPYLHIEKRPRLIFSLGIPLLVILFGITFTLFGPYVVRLVHASFGSWGDSSLIHACEDSRGIVTLVSTGASCATGLTQVTWLKDVNAGNGLTISRSSSGATLSLANQDGWAEANDTWTYVSATSFKISGADRTAIFTKGTRVKLTNNSTTYYGVVLSSSYSTDTTVTLFANNDYSLANSAITNPSYSYEANPQGYPGSFNFTPTYTSGGGAFTNNPATNKATFFIVGNKMFYWVDFTYNANSGGSGYTQINLPVAAKDQFESGSGQNISNSFALSVAADAAGRTFVYKYDGTTAIANGAQLSVNGSYSF